MYLKVAENVDPKSSHTTRKELCCTPETIMSFISQWLYYLLIKQIFIKPLFCASYWS